MSRLENLLHRVEAGTTTARDAAVLRYMLHDFATSMSGLTGGRWGVPEMLDHYWKEADRICPPEEVYEREGISNPA